MIRVVVVSLLAVVACKKQDNAGAEPPPTGDKRVTDSTTWTSQSGPGFSVRAPGPATTEKANDGARAFDRFTFHKTELESYVVEITTLRETDDLGMELGNLRMRIASRTQAVQHEDLIKGGEVTGHDLWYVVDQDDHVLRARSKLYGKAQKIYEVRSVSPENAAREAEAEKFVDSFALTP